MGEICHVRVGFGNKMVTGITGFQIHQVFFEQARITKEPSIPYNVMMFHHTISIHQVMILLHLEVSSNHTALAASRSCPQVVKMMNGPP